MGVCVACILVDLVKPVLDAQVLQIRLGDCGDEFVALVDVGGATGCEDGVEPSGQLNHLCAPLVPLRGARVGSDRSDAAKEPDEGYPRHGCGEVGVGQGPR